MTVRLVAGAPAGGSDAIALVRLPVTRHGATW
jgi:hypothetical protein